MRWSEQLQRATLAALCENKLGRAEGVTPDLFSGARYDVACAVIDYRDRLGAWPSIAMLMDVVRSFTSENQDAVGETKRIRQVQKSDRVWAGEKAGTELRREAMRQAVIDIESIVADGNGNLQDARSILEKALLVGTEEKEPYGYRTKVQRRHRREVGAGSSNLIAQTNVPSLDKALRGGIRAGKLGLIFGPSKRGKSHLGCLFGAQPIRGGSGRTLHITLELDDEETARRYDRCLTGMSQHMIFRQRAEFKRRWEAAVPEPDNLQILRYPRYGLTIQGVHDLLKKYLDIWGAPCLLIVDYGSILRPVKDDVRHAAVGKIHENMSTIAVEEKVPIWTPFQVNRQGMFAEDGNVHLGMAGDSYEAVQHADYILAMCQSGRDALKKRMRLDLTSRDSEGVNILVEHHWETSSVEELASNREDGDA